MLRKFRNIFSSYSRIWYVPDENQQCRLQGGLPQQRERCRSLHASFCIWLKPMKYCYSILISYDLIWYISTSCFTFILISIYIIHQINKCMIFARQKCWIINIVIKYFNNKFQTFNHLFNCKEFFIRILLVRDKLITAGFVKPNQIQT